MTKYQMTPHRHRRQTFDDECHLPAKHLDDVAGDGRHPEDRDGVAEDQDRVGTRTLLPREPLGQQDEHAGQDETLCSSEQQAIDRKQAEVFDDAGQRSENAPGDKRGKDETACGPLACIGCAGYLKEEVPEEEKGAQQCGLA